MAKPLTRRTIFTSLCLAAVPIRSSAIETTTNNSHKLLQQIAPVDNEFVAIDGWVIPRSTLTQVQRVK